MSYYEVLGISKNATQSEIRRAYLLKAKEWHPDKNQGNKVAEEKFKSISQAYSVLSDEEKRRVYDTHGEEGVRSFESAEQFEFKDLIKSLFGAGKFDDIFDDIFFTDILLSSDGQMPSDKSNDELQKEVSDFFEKECQRFSVILMDKIEPFLEFKRHEFMSQLREDVEDKLESPGGPELLMLIGYIYVNETEKMSDKYFGLKRLYATMKESAVRLKSNIKALSEAYKFKVASDEYESNPEDEKLRQVYQDKGLDVIWKMGKLEIERLVRSTCKLVLRNQNVEKSKLKLIIDAIRTIGKMYKEKGSEHYHRMKKSQKSKVEEIEQ